MVEVTLEALAGIAVAITVFIVGYLRNMRKDICRDINAKHQDLKSDISEVKADTQISKTELREYLALREKITADLDQRLSRLEGRTIERDQNRDPLSYNSKQKEVYSNG